MIILREDEEKEIYQLMNKVTLGEVMK